MRFAKQYDVFAELPASPHRMGLRWSPKIKLGHVIYNGKSEFDKFEDWEFYNLSTDFGGDGLLSMVDALESLLDQYNFDETFEIKLVPHKVTNFTPRVQQEQKAQNWRDGPLCQPTTYDDS